MASDSSLTDRAKYLIHEGNVRHVVATKAGHRAVDLPLNLILIGGVLAPWLLAILVVIGLLMGYSMGMERREAVTEPLAGAPPDARPTDSPAPDWATEDSSPPGESRTF